MPYPSLRGLAATLLVATSAWAAPATLGAPSTIGSAAGSYRNAPASYESQVLYWTNVQRRSRGIRPLRAGSCVDRYAESWARHLAATTSFYHQLMRPILSSCHRHSVAENIGRGNVSARRMVGLWMHSPDHRHNLLSRSSTRLGVGSVYSPRGQLYTVQDFGG
jgi:uncharacterized protein YkwD